MSFLPQISSELGFTFLLGFIVSLLALIMQFVNSRYSVRQMAQASIMKAIDLMESTRCEIGILYDIKKSGKGFNTWSEDDREAARAVVRTFDILGVLDNSGNIDHKFVDRFYAGVCVDIWNICKDFVYKEQEIRGPQYLWEFEQFAKRVEYVHRNHPAFLEKKWWYRYPRRWYRYPRHKDLHF